MPNRRPPKRIRRTESQWTEILREFAECDLGPVEFCSRRNLALASFQRWRLRVGPIEPAKFVELKSSTSAESSSLGTWSLDVTLPNGVALRFRG